MGRVTHPGIPLPLLNAFEEWLTEQRRKALPKSPIGQVIAYARSNRSALRRYTEHGELSIDNNLAERMLRAQAIGRKNYTFLGSDRGGRTAAVLYSFTGTCKHHDIDPFAYLRDILHRLPTHPAGRLEGLLPDVWFASHPSARRTRAARTGGSGHEHRPSRPGAVRRRAHRLRPLLPAAV